MIPAVNASDCQTEIEQSTGVLSDGKAIVHFENMTEIKIIPEKVESTKVPLSIQKYDLVVFDTVQIKNLLLCDEKLTVYLSGEPYEMDLHEHMSDTESRSKGIHSFVGTLVGVDGSEVVLTVSDRVILCIIRLNGTEYYIDSTSVKDPDYPDHYLQYTYSSHDIVSKGDPILIDSPHLQVDEIDENALLQKKELEKQFDPCSDVTVRVLVVTDEQWMDDEPDWEDKAANIILLCNYEMNTIGVNLVPIYDTSKARQLSEDPRITTYPFNAFRDIYSASYLDSKNADVGLYLSGYDVDLALGGSAGYDCPKPDCRYAWAQMADDESSYYDYEDPQKDRAVVTLHEIGHIFDADHQDGHLTHDQKETYNRAYQFYEHGKYWQTVTWAYFMKSNWLDFSANDGFYGDADHDNKRRICETKGVVASYR